MERFERALAAGTEGLRQTTSIGRLKEHALHAVLKYYIQPDGGFHEIKMGGYVADCICDGTIYEIQTGDFVRFRKKLACLLEEYAVTVVVPVVRRTRIHWIDRESGERSGGRLSGKIGRLSDALADLYWIRESITHPFLKVMLIEADIDELRLRGRPPGRWTRKSYSRTDRIPTGFGEKYILEKPEDYLRLLPELPEPFTREICRRALGMTVRNGYNAIHLLLAANAIVPSGKQGKAYTYRTVRSI